MIGDLSNHLWQSTLVVAIAALVTLALRNNGAHVRHRIWMVASLKFLVPFSLLTGLGETLRVDAGGNERGGGLASTSWVSTGCCR